MFGFRVSEPWVQCLGYIYTYHISTYTKPRNVGQGTLTLLTSSADPLRWGRGCKTLNPSQPYLVVARAHFTLFGIILALIKPKVYTCFGLMETLNSKP